MRDEPYTSTPDGVLPFIRDMVRPFHGKLLDPFAGDGRAGKYLADGWGSLLNSIEPRHELAIQAKANGAILEETFESCFCRSFRVIYAYPPIGSQTKYGELLWKSLAERGVLIYRLPYSRLVDPKFITDMATFFEKFSVWRDPPLIYQNGSHYILRAIRRHSTNTAPSTEKDTELVLAITDATVLGDERIRPVEVPYANAEQFRAKSLEWEDVAKEAAMVSWPIFDNIFNDGNVISQAAASLKEEIQKGNLAATIPAPNTVNSTYDSCWSDFVINSDRKIQALSLLGRKTHVASVIRGAASTNVVTSRYSYSKASLEGGTLGWRKNYTVHTVVLPTTGAVHTLIWHNNSVRRRTPTGKGEVTGIPCILPTNNPALAAKLLANLSGMPIAPEWADLCADALNRPFSAFSYGNAKSRIVNVSTAPIFNALTKAVEQGVLPTPTGVPAEVLRPLMPPSAGIWAQLAMQEFINDVPLPGGIIMHAMPLEITDRMSEENASGGVEVTDIVRRDAVRITVFNYHRGTWEIFETEREEDAIPNPIPTP